MSLSDQNIIEKVYVNLRYYAIKLTNKRVYEAEELLHNTMVRVIERIERYDPSMGTMLSWCSSIMHNLFIDEKRKQTNENVSIINYCSDNYNYINFPYFNDENIVETHNALREIKSRLTGQHRQIFIFRSMGMSYKEISGKLNISADKARLEGFKMYQKAIL